MELRYLTAAVMTLVLIGALAFIYLRLTRDARAERRAHRRADKRRLLARRQPASSRAGP